MTVPHYRFCALLIFIFYQYWMFLFYETTCQTHYSFLFVGTFENILGLKTKMSLEFVQLNQFKVNIKTVLLWSVSDSNAQPQGLRQLYLSLNNELRWIILWCTSQVTIPTAVGCSSKKTLCGDSSRKFYKIEISFFLPIIQEACIAIAIWLNV